MVTFSELPTSLRDVKHMIFMSWQANLNQGC